MEVERMSVLDHVMDYAAGKKAARRPWDQKLWAERAKSRHFWQGYVDRRATMKEICGAIPEGELFVSEFHQSRYLNASFRMELHPDAARLFVECIFDMDQRVRSLKWDNPPKPLSDKSRVRLIAAADKGVI